MVTDGKDLGGYIFSLLLRKWFKVCGNHHISVVMDVGVQKCDRMLSDSVFKMFRVHSTDIL